MDVFCASRLTVARQRRGMTKRALADHIGLSAPMVTHFEADTRAPQTHQATAIALALGFPLGFFFAEPVALLKPENASFRARRALTAGERDAGLACGSIAGSILSPALRSRFVLPEVSLPDLSDVEPEAAASEVRASWRMGDRPIANVVHLLEAAGVEVYCWNGSSEHVDAFSIWHAGLPLVLLNLRKDAGERGRFDAAHELGHLVLHRHEERLGTQQQEIEANRFASALLLPRGQFLAECPRRPTVTDFLRLKPRWGVSVAALGRRVLDLGLWREWQYVQFCQELGRRGYRTHEPDPLPREHSRLHEVIFGKMAEKGRRPSQFAAEIDLPVDVMFELCPQSMAVESLTAMPSPSDPPLRHTTVHRHLHAV